MSGTATSMAPPAAAVTASGKLADKPKRTREKRVCRLERFTDTEGSAVNAASGWETVTNFVDETAAKKHVRDEELEGRFRTVLVGPEFMAKKETKTVVRLS